MKAVALILAVIGLALTIVGLLSELNAIDLGAVGTWSPIIGIALWFVALAIFKRTHRA
ncbi:hypothetical protein [Acidisphaera sp. L21]|uniref:hypothetical protein n=1 Tax=Acidisphaera sp. L21 TaxID=1641851 RepID=UPI00131BD715|nr:hypothetical protein [Acidisphaera sp. L21]